MKNDAVIKKRLWISFLIGVVGLGIGIGMKQFSDTEKTAVMIQTNQQNQSNILQGNWKYIDGVERVDAGLKVNPLQRVIVEQDGSVAQTNSPINIAGAHVTDISDGFVINTTIDFLQSNTATIQLYGNLPIIADEFKIDRGSIGITLTKSNLVVKIWKSMSQHPVEVRTFPVKTDQINKLYIEKSHDTYIFVVNGQKVGEVSDHNVFASEKIWFGLDSEDAEWLLRDLRIEKKNGDAVSFADGATVTLQEKNMQSMQKLVLQKRNDFVIGGAMASGALVGDSAFAYVALNDFGSVTPENEMKMVNLQPKRGVYTFAQADGLVHIAKANALTVHGHTLVFGEANPPWLAALPTNTKTEKAVVSKIMQDHIQTVVTHYKNDIFSWDVINEPLADYEEFTLEQPLRAHIWYRAMGESYIITALETAYRANPDAMLFINEYGLEADDERWNAMYALLKRLKPQLEQRGIPVDQVGVGFQSHIYERGDRIDATVLRKHIKQLAELGYKAQISELDVYSADGDTVQADQYVNVLRACLEESNCIAWRVWIIADRYNFWKNDDGHTLQGKDGLYDTSLQPRPARNAIGQYLKQ